MLGKGRNVVYVRQSEKMYLISWHLSRNMKEVRVQAMWLYLEVFRKESTACTDALRQKSACCILERARKQVHLGWSYKEEQSGTRLWKVLLTLGGITLLLCKMDTTGRFSAEEFIILVFKRIALAIILRIGIYLCIRNGIKMLCLLPRLTSEITPSTCFS